MADKFYYIDSEGRIEECHSLDEAKTCANGALESARDEAGGDFGWPEETRHIEYGRMLPLAETRVSSSREPEPHESRFDEIVDYTLEPIPDELAQLRTDNARPSARVLKLEAALRDRDESRDVWVKGQEVTKHGFVANWYHEEQGRKRYVPYSELAQLRERVAEIYPEWRLAVGALGAESVRATNAEIERDSLRDRVAELELALSIAITKLHTIGYWGESEQLRKHLPKDPNA